MPEFTTFFALWTILEDPDAYYEEIDSQIDPNLVDQLRAYATARQVPLQEPLMQALQLFMLSSAEDAWRELSSSAMPHDKLRAAPLNAILERFLKFALDPSRQRLIDGPAQPSIINQFRRVPEE